MRELLKKTALIGIGLASMTKDKIEHFAKQLADEANLSEEEGRKFVDDILKQSEKTKQSVEESVEKTVRNILAKMDVPTRSDLKALDERLAALESAIKDAKGPER